MNNLAVRPVIEATNVIKDFVGNHMDNSRSVKVEVTMYGDDGIDRTMSARGFKNNSIHIAQSERKHK